MPTGDQLFDVSDKVVVITGASSGIGASAARCFAERGAHVVVAARREDRLTELTQTLPSALAVQCDVADPDSCERLISAAFDWRGKIDVLINNAGAYQIEPAEQESIASFRHVVDTNLLSTFALSQGAAVHMLEAGSGSIINISSIFGIVGSGAIPQASYAASKGGVISLTRELSAQWARRGVRVNAIAPAFFDTEMTAGKLDDESSMRWLRRQTPLGRRGELGELHGALVFLASGASTYVTGVTLPVDGGWTSV